MGDAGRSLPERWAAVRHTVEEKLGQAIDELYQDASDKELTAFTALDGEDFACID